MAISMEAVKEFKDRAEVHKLNLTRAKKNYRRVGSNAKRAKWRALETLSKAGIDLVNSQLHHSWE